MVLSSGSMVMTFFWSRFALYDHNSFAVVANNRGRGDMHNLNMWLMDVVPMMWCVVCRSSNDNADKTDCYNSCYHDNSPMLSFLDEGETVLFNRFYILPANPSSNDGISGVGCVAVLIVGLVKPDEVEWPSAYFFISVSDIHNHSSLHSTGERVLCDHLMPHSKTLLFHLLRPQDYRTHLHRLSSL